MPVEIIQQSLHVQPWPLQATGDRKFFGYIVAIGLFPFDWTKPDGLLLYADFSYNDKYERFHLPNDRGLLVDLTQILHGNVRGAVERTGVYGKMHIIRREKDYAIRIEA